MGKKQVTQTVEPQVVALKKVWTQCANGHTYYYECGVIVDPIPVTAECCGASVLDSGSSICGEG